ncbi:MAG: hypothetical protein P8183_24480, partial [Anaerolineae bacterium]
WSMPLVITRWGTVFLPQNTANIAGLMISLARQSIQPLLDLWQRRIYWQAGGVLLAGILFLTVGLFAKTRRQPTTHEL